MSYRHAAPPGLRKLPTAYCHLPTAFPHQKLTMSVSVKELRTYTSFARRFAGKFVRDRIEERRIPVLPAPHRPEPAMWSDERLTVAWLGHATVLMNFYGTWLLTDPALRPRVGVRVGLAKVKRLSVRSLSALPITPRYWMALLWSSGVDPPRASSLSTSRARGALLCASTNTARSRSLGKRAMWAIISAL